MTVGSFSKDYRISLAGITGVYGLIASRSWNGADRPKIVRAKPARLYDSYSVPVKVWRGGRQVTYTHRYRLRRYTPDDRPPKRALPDKTDHAFSKTWTSRFDGQLTLADGRVFTTAGAGYSLRGFADALSIDKENQLLSKLREAVAGSDFNAGVFLAELKPAFQMIGDAAVRINHARQYLKHGLITRAADALVRGSRYERADRHLDPVRLKATKDISSNWLQLQYGWLPLLADVENAAQFAAHHLNWPLQKVYRVAVKQRTGSFANSSPSNILIPSLTHGDTDVLGFGYEFLTRKSIKATISEKNVPQLAGLTDPLSVAWELMPYSFVVDWFVPIGSWLSNRALAQAISGSFVTSVKREAWVRGMKLNAANHQKSSKDYWDRNGSFSRSLSTSLSVPLPTMRPLAKAASVMHALNGIALLVNPAVKRGVADRNYAPVAPV
jgi:hypothetical protein